MMVHQAALKDSRNVKESSYRSINCTKVNQYQNVYAKLSVGTHAEFHSNPIHVHLLADR
jgi:hypothetical protein